VEDQTQAPQQRPDVISVAVVGQLMAENVLLTYFILRFLREQIDSRLSKTDFRKFSPEWARMLREITIKRLVEDVRKNYAQITKGE